jgi:6-phosphogluconolactonase
MEIHTFNDEAAWLGALLEAWQETAGTVLRRRGTVSAALCGGSSPGSFYRALAATDWPWSAMRFYIGDERWVPRTHADSNHHLAYSAFYPHRIRLEGWLTEGCEPDTSALDFERRLKRDLGNPPRFDLMLLGIGTDGHTASLFPGTKALEIEDRFAVSNYIPHLSAHRMTVTFPVIREARELWFLTKGAAKEPWIRQMEQGTGDFPAARAARAAAENENPVKIFHLAGA